MNIPISLVSRYIGWMTYTINDIEQLAVEKLTAAELNILADRLWRRAHGSHAISTDDEPEFVAEIQRRVKAVHDGTAKLYTHNDVMAELRARCK